VLGVAIASGDVPLAAAGSGGEAFLISYLTGTPKPNPVTALEYYLVGFELGYSIGEYLDAM